MHKTYCNNRYLDCWNNQFHYTRSVTTALLKTILCKIELGSSQRRNGVKRISEISSITEQGATTAQYYSCKNDLRDMVWGMPLDCYCTPNSTYFQSYYYWSQLSTVIMGNTRHHPKCSFNLNISLDIRIPFFIIPELPRRAVTSPVETGHFPRLSCRGSVVMQICPSTPNIAPCNSHLFQPFNGLPGGQKFEHDEQVEHVHYFLRSFKLYATGFMTLVRRRKKYV